MLSHKSSSAAKKPPAGYFGIGRCRWSYVTWVIFDDFVSQKFGDGHTMSYGHPPIFMEEVAKFVGTFDCYP